MWLQGICEAKRIWLAAKRHRRLSREGGERRQRATLRTKKASHHPLMPFGSPLSLALPIKGEGKKFSALIPSPLAEEG
jgi:hypothetical protein